MILPLQDQFDLLVSAAIPGGKFALTEEQNRLLQFFYFSGARATFMSTIGDPEGSQQTDKDILEAVKQLTEDLDVFFRASTVLPKPAAPEDEYPVQ